MLPFEDNRWTKTLGGYRVPFDPRPLLKKLEKAEKLDDVWSELGGELFHPGDVGEASCATVPLLVRSHEHGGAPDAVTYAIISTIDLARGEGKNPEIPNWLQPGCDDAIARLGELGLRDLSKVRKIEEIPSVLGFLALWKGARTYANVHTWYGENELPELVEKGINAP